MRITQQDMEDYRRHLIEEERASSTVALYLSAIKRFAAFVQEEELSKECVLAYKAQLLEMYAPATVNSKIGIINSFLKYMGEPKLCMKRLRIQKQFYLPEERQLTCGEYRRLVQTAQQTGNTRMATCLQIICATGIRVSELRDITVEAAHRGRAVICNKGKTRTILLPEGLCRRILDYAAQQKITAGPLILSSTGKPLDRTTVWRQMKKLCETAGIETGKGHPHALRHLFAVTYYRESHDPFALADLLGHSSVDTTRIYTAGTGAEQMQQLEKLGLML